MQSPRPLEISSPTAREPPWCMSPWNIRAEGIWFVYVIPEQNNPCCDALKEYIQQERGGVAARYIADEAEDSWPESECELIEPTIKLIVGPKRSLGKSC